ncbi:HMBS family protein [Megaselia abdita]
MTTMGDRVLNVSLPKIGEKSLFTRDLEDALRNGGVDFVVHSLKDLPTALPEGMAIGAVLEREDARDALVLNEKFKGKTLDQLPKGSVIGTSSLRRTAQLRRLYPDLVVNDVRGNLNTRLAKLDAENSKYSGIILAQAGLVRMGWESRISQVLEPSNIMYAVGQGALAVECRSNDEDVLEMLNSLVCLETVCRIIAERSFLKTLGGGCSAPVAVHTELGSECLKIKGAVWSLDGATQIEDNRQCSIEPIKNKKMTTATSNNEDYEVARKRIRLDSGSSSSTPATISGLSKELIEKHGDLLKKCPFYNSHINGATGNNGDNGNSNEECPIKIPVGQDVMGKCPFFDADSEVKDDAVKEPSKCPFSSIHKQIEDSNGNIQGNKRKCPFNIQEYSADSVDDNDLPTLSTDCSNLFCGLYRHTCYPQALFESCEKLGTDLANDLVNKGALEVMAVAQNLIRKDIK